MVNALLPSLAGFLTVLPEEATPSSPEQPPVEAVAGR
jgi:hypothetical protein